MPNLYTYQTTHWVPNRPVLTFDCSSLAITKPVLAGFANSRAYKGNLEASFSDPNFLDLQSTMAPLPAPYSGTSTLALVARASAFTFGLAYGSIKLKYLKAKAKSQKKAEAKAHH
ncbi:hypothetical protein HAX54_029961 [Datura stramonium]|uniref:ATP synthase subunit e, mitochondrial n=1 Tax=Datura stramonium TaxID=4076 RepID=A0ABS8V8Y6_DATST|nr:hypothetical protein [Datura stramonium]